MSPASLEKLTVILFIASGIFLTASIIYALRFNVISSLLFDIEQRKLRKQNKEADLINKYGNQENRKITGTISVKEKNADPKLIADIPEERTDKQAAAVPYTFSPAQDSNSDPSGRKTVPAAKPVNATVPVARSVNAAVPAAKPANATVPAAKPVSATVPAAKPVSAAVPVAKPVSATVPAAKPVSATVPAAKFENKNNSVRQEESQEISEEIRNNNTIAVKKKTQNPSGLFKITKSITVIPCSEEELKCIEEI